MVKRIVLLLLVVVILIQPVESFAANSAKASPLTTTIFVGNNHHYLFTYEMGGKYYYKLRDIANVLSETSSCFNISWNSYSNSIEIITGQKYDISKKLSQHVDYSMKKTVKLQNINLYKDGVNLKLEGFNVDGNNYFELGKLGEIFDFEIELTQDDKFIIFYPLGAEGSYRVHSQLAKKSNLDTIKNLTYAETKQSYIINNHDGTISVIEYRLDNGIIVETYDSDFKLVSTKEMI